MTCATPGISLPTTGACPSGSYSYTYDGNGLRASSTSPNGVISNFTYSLTSPSPQILTDSANAYIYGPSGTPLGNAPLEQISISQPTQLPLYLLSGPSGVTNTFDSQGLVGTQSYDPWGNITSSNNMTTPFGYQGAYTDPTGFQYLINRYYDPSTGQFLSVDPLVQLTGQAYAYAGDNPINFNDPFGLCNQKKHCSWWNPLCAVTSAWHAVSHFVSQHKRLLEGIGIVLAGAVLVAGGVGLGVGLAAAVSEAADASEFGIVELLPHLAFIVGTGGTVAVSGIGFIVVGGRIIYVGNGEPG